MIWIIVFVIVGLFIFDKPPITCLVQCKFNNFMRKLFTKELEKIKNGKPLNSYGLKELKRIYRWTAKMTCQDNPLYSYNYENIREKIKSEIVDRELLGL